MAPSSPQPSPPQVTPSRRRVGRRKTAFMPNIKGILALVGAGAVTLKLQVKDETHHDGGPSLEAPLYLDRTRGDGARIPVRPADLSGSRLRAKHLYNTRNEQPKALRLKRAPPESPSFADAPPEDLRGQKLRARHLYNTSNEQPKALC